MHVMRKYNVQGFAAVYVVESIFQKLNVELNSALNSDLRENSQVLGYKLLCTNPP